MAENVFFKDMKDLGIAQSLGGMSFIKLPKLKGCQANALGILRDGPTLMNVTGSMYVHLLRDINFTLTYPDKYLEGVPVKQDGRYELENLPALAVGAFEEKGERFMMVLGRYEKWAEVLCFHHDPMDDRMVVLEFFGGTSVHMPKAGTPVEFNVTCP